MAKNRDSINGYIVHDAIDDYTHFVDTVEEAEKKAGEVLEAGVDAIDITVYELGRSYDVMQAGVVIVGLTD